MPEHGLVPDIPGLRVSDPEHLWTLRRHMADICQLQQPRFPGSQPVSFDEDSLKLLESENFWVCEKSDGIRVLTLIVSTDTEQEVYLVDRKFDFYRQWGLPFPHQDGPEYTHSNTILDGELVLDKEDSGGHILRLLLFDLLVCDSTILMHKPLSSRYGKLQSWIIEPQRKLLDSRPDLKRMLPFEVVLKKQELAYGIKAVFLDHLPKLKHGNDGLIFTSAEAPYTMGTDQKILKWKPPEENSVDFVLELRFPPSQEDPNRPDFTEKPLFMLLMNHGSEHRYFDTMQVDDETWEEWKRSGEQYDNRVVECVWDFAKENWRILRFRDDKYEGNYKTVVLSILKSVQQRITADTLIEKATDIKAGWRARERARNEAAAGRQGHEQAQGQSQGQQQQQQQQQQPPSYSGKGGYGAPQQQAPPSNGHAARHDPLSSLKR